MTYLPYEDSLRTLRDDISLTLDHSLRGAMDELVWLGHAADQVSELNSGVLLQIVSSHVTTRKGEAGIGSSS